MIKLQPMLRRKHMAALLLAIALMLSWARYSDLAGDVGVALLPTFSWVEEQLAQHEGQQQDYRQDSGEEEEKGGEENSHNSNVPSPGQPSQRRRQKGDDLTQQQPLSEDQESSKVAVLGTDDPSTSTNSNDQKKNSSSASTIHETHTSNNSDNDKPKNKNLAQHATDDTAPAESVAKTNDTTTNVVVSGDAINGTLPIGSQNIGSHKSTVIVTDKTIRSWGCHRTETPFIFLHMNKAGGGSVRARLAASALDYKRTRWLNVWDDDAYYPVRRVLPNGTTIDIRAQFCNQQFPGFESFTIPFTKCQASTPIGHAIGCPHVWVRCNKKTQRNGQVTEHQVYVGHNIFGHEIHWLPVHYLEAWWNQHWAVSSSTKQKDPIAKLWRTLNGETMWCDEQRRPKEGQRINGRLIPTANRTTSACAQQLQMTVDSLTMRHFQQTVEHVPVQTPLQRAKAWSDVYASLPVLRATVTRNPFTWLMSKFFWHRINRNHTCDDLADATYGSGRDDNITLGMYNSDFMRGPGPGWARRFALWYLYSLCGTDCLTRHYHKRATLSELEAQAEYNLRQSFAVVGVSDRIDEFFAMVDARVDYIDTTRNPSIEGGRHSTSNKHPEAVRCKQRYQESDFQAQLVAASPEIAAIVRLYRVAEEVNAFQKQELASCSGNSSRLLPRHTMDVAAPAEGAAKRNDTTTTRKDVSVASSSGTLTSSNNISNSIATIATDKTIRSWGCHRTETPFIFLHMNKAGGGSVRARLAASAIDYKRANWLNVWDDDAYYPVRRVLSNGTVAKIRAQFCNQQFPGFESLTIPFAKCQASTPIGHAIGCPDVWVRCNKKTEPYGHVTEHQVYVGHNIFGHEIHWLPTHYLETWWKDRWAVSSSAKKKDPIANLWPTLNGETKWCNEQRRPKRGQKVEGRMGNQTSTACAQQLQTTVDSLTMRHFQHSLKHVPVRTPLQRAKAWSDVYASLPVLRVTVTRNPFSWLMSKFFWHGIHRNHTCDDLADATYGSGRDDDITLGMYTSDFMRGPGPGWARRYALWYLYSLCGADCVTRHYHKRATLPELEAQAEYNLRQSFAVVGVSDRMDDFFAMVDARVDYIDTTRNPRIAGGRHSTDARHAEPVRCKQRYQESDFQAQLVAASPEIASIVRLYRVAEEVNAFQKQELATCSNGSRLRSQ